MNALTELSKKLNKLEPLDFISEINELLYNPYHDFDNVTTDEVRYIITKYLKCNKH